MRCLGTHYNGINPKHFLKKITRKISYVTTFYSITNARFHNLNSLQIALIMYTQI